MSIWTLTWAPRLFGKWQMAGGGWHDYRYIPARDKKLFVAPYEPVLLAVLAVNFLLMVGSGQFEWPVWMCGGAVLLGIGLVAKRSLRVCRASRQLREFASYKIRSFLRKSVWRARWVRAAVWHQTPIILRSLWFFFWYTTGFRWREQGIGWYAYRRNPRRERRDTVTVLEVIAMGIFVASAVSSMNGTTLMAWENMAAPVISAWGNSICAAMIVVLVAHRKSRDYKRQIDSIRDLTRSRVVRILRLTKLNDDRR